MLGSGVLFDEERAVEKTGRDSITSAIERKDDVYRECYELLHGWLIDHALLARDGVYTGCLKERLGFLQRNSICKVVGDSKKLLDVGCGDGALSIALAMLGNDVVGIDISPKILIQAIENKRRAHVGNVQFRCMSASSLRFSDESFDLVISTDLIEHLHPQDLLPHLIEVKRVLRRGGQYVVSTPNRLSGHTIPLHLKEYTYAELARLLEYAGLDCKSFLFSPNVRSLPFLLVSVHMKIMLEKLHLILKRVRGFWIIPGLDYVTIVASKPATAAQRAYLF